MDRRYYSMRLYFAEADLLHDGRGEKVYWTAISVTATYLKPLCSHWQIARKNSMDFFCTLFNSPKRTSCLARSLRIRKMWSSGGKGLSPRLIASELRDFGR